MQLRDWAWDHLHNDFHLEVVYSQSEMDFSDLPDEDEAEEGDDEEEEPELDPDNQPVIVKSIRPAKKSGPKELAAEHARPSN